MEIIAVKLSNPGLVPKRSIVVKICRMDKGSPLPRMKVKGFFLSLVLVDKPNTLKPYWRLWFSFFWSSYLSNVFRIDNMA